ncbi:MAG TPA: Fe-S cluster assembly protein SufD [Candidatus Angelobacter sp.]|nr:Fe-S cluster assembly protein SufD [Candidatus Angelobacter sp.]
MPRDSRTIPLPYADRFAAVADTLPGHDLPWLRDLRAQAIERVRQLGLPTIRNERWKYTNLSSLAAVAFEPAGAESSGPPGRLPSLIGGCRVVFVNGSYRADLSTGSLPGGIALTSLAELVRKHPDRARTLFGEHDAGDSLGALNVAFARDGYVIEVTAGATIEAPIELLHLTTAAAAYHARNAIVAEPGSSATVIETFLHDGATVYWSQPVTAVRVGSGATLRHYKDQNEGSKAFHTAATDVRVADRGRYESFVLTTGAALSRNEIAVILDGCGASCRLDSAYLARDRQHADNTTAIIHAKPQTTSAEVYKGVLDDQARAVFQGRIVVEKDAQKADGHQLNKTILLSDRAEIDTKPELEIFADDVKCSHGAAAGELDEDALFYLRARGIGQAEARRMLVEAFVGETLESISNLAVRAVFERRIGSWMSAAVEQRA